MPKVVATACFDFSDDNSSVATLLQSVAVEALVGGVLLLLLEEAAVEAEAVTCSCCFFSIYSCAALGDDDYERKVQPGLISIVYLETVHGTC